MNGKINIAFVDDEELFLEGLSILFTQEESVSVVCLDTDGERFLNTLSGLPENRIPEIALIDLKMEPLNGFDLIERLKKLNSSIKIIVLSSYYKMNIFGHMIKLGVSAFIPKNSNKEELMQAIHAVSNTGIYLTAKDHRMLMSYLNSQQKTPSFTSSEKLSKREIEVLKLICKEQTNQEIAEQLFISVRTVESHRQNILDKTGAKNTVGIVLYAILNNIHPLPPFQFSV